LDSSDLESFQVAPSNVARDGGENIGFAFRPLLVVETTPRIDKIRELIRNLDSEIRARSLESLEPPPKDLFESTQEYQARVKKFIERHRDQPIAALRSAASSLRNALYRADGAKVEFITYDADTRIMSVKIAAQPRMYEVGRSEARDMYNNISDVGVAHSFEIEAVCPFLYWNNRTYPPVDECTYGTLNVLLAADLGMEEINAFLARHKMDPVLTGREEVASRSEAEANQGMRPPVPILKVEPNYSEAARKARLEGQVLLTLVVDQEGSPKEIRVARSLGLGLDEEAIKAVQQWRFRPAYKDGQPVASPANVEVNFRLIREPPK
jgi:TonB family protein